MNRPSLKSRKLRLESLEERRLLSVNWVVTTNTDYSAWVEDDSIICLREALSRAGDDDLITFSPNLPGTTFTLKYGELPVNSAVTIDGDSLRAASGTNRLVINANSRSRIFNVAEGASLTLRSANMTNGYSSGDGGAIYNKGTLILENCNITASRAKEGGGIFSFHADVSMNGGSVINCSVSEFGGGLYIYWGSLTLDGVSVSNCSSDMSGAGIDVSDAETYITRSTISNNRITNSYYFAAGIYAHGGYMSISDSKIVGNVSYNYGGGIYIHDMEAVITNSLIAGNKSTYTGAGIENFGQLTLRQCTITGNHTTGDYSGGAGIFNYYGSGMYVDAYNCIIAGNTSASGKVTCDYEGNGYGYAYNILTGNIDDWNYTELFFEYDPALPLFTNPDEGIYTLAEGSQAIDLGENAYAFYDDGSDIEYDLAGKDRFYGLSVDLGAYEYSPLTPLDAPTGVTVTAAGANRMRVTWNEAADNSGYKVAWSDDQITWNEAFCAENTIRVTGLAYGETYYFKVMALGDGVTYANSDYSASVAGLVCPVDIDGDGFIGPGDNSILSAAWFTLEGSGNWDERCDIDGDGFIGPGDRSFLSVNWFKTTDQGTIVYPPALAAAVSSENIFASLDDELEEILEGMF
ncbi:MAG: fibronectin type III domain-containing protein [Thermoguttaceae bacterium]|nr:fibronectin type III domain-containing protein [Thermoguttaceae bacterium]